MSNSTKFDEEFYGSQNRDVADAIEENFFESFMHHYELFGADEGRAPNEIFSPIYYASQNSDVVEAVVQGHFRHEFHHYQVLWNLIYKYLLHLAQMYFL